MRSALWDREREPVRWSPGCPRTLGSGQRGPNAQAEGSGTSAYPTGAFLLEGIPVLGDTSEKRVVSGLRLHVILDFLARLGNLQRHQIRPQSLFICQNTGRIQDSGHRGCEPRWRVDGWEVVRDP